MGGVSSLPSEEETIYQDSLDRTAHDIDSAIENLENGLITERPKITEAPVQMRDQYIVQQAAAVGPHAHAQDVTFNQQLFERRYNVYEATREFVATIMTKGRASQKEEIKWGEAIRVARFLFEVSIASYMEELFQKNNKLQALEDTLKGLPEGKERSEKVDRIGELREWFMAEWKGGLEDRFAPYLQLKG